MVVISQVLSPFSLFITIIFFLYIFCSIPVFTSLFLSHLHFSSSLQQTKELLKHTTVGHYTLLLLRAPFPYYPRDNRGEGIMGTCKGCLVGKLSCSGTGGESVQCSARVANLKPGTNSFPIPPLICFPLPLGLTCHLQTWVGS